jgi:hypothetical protein
MGVFFVSIIFTIILETITISSIPTIFRVRNGGRDRRKGGVSESGEGEGGVSESGEGEGGGGSEEGERGGTS